MEPSLHNNSNEASTFQQLKGKKEMTVLRRTIHTGQSLSRYRDIVCLPSSFVKTFIYAHHIYNILMYVILTYLKTDVIKFPN